MAILSVYDKDGNRIDIPAIRGDKGDTGAAGPKGDTGADGYTPVKEVDYFTPEDQAKLAEEAAKLVDVPVVTQEEGESEALVMSQKAVTRLVRESVNSIGGIEKLIDFTTTEPTMSFQFPIDTDELRNKWLKASEIHVYVYVPRNEEDAESTTTGTVSIGLMSVAGYRPAFVHLENIIPNPQITYVKYGTSIAKIFLDTFSAYLERDIFVMQGANGGTLKSSTGGIDLRGVSASANSYLFVDGTQPMAAGTRFVLGVRE